MRSRSVTFAVVLCALAAGGAAYAHFHAQQLRTDGQWLLERGTAQGDEYATTLDSKIAEEQLVTLDQRREVLERAQLWQRFELMGILIAVVSAFSSYVLYLFRRLREQLVDASTPLDELPAQRS